MLALKVTFANDSEHSRILNLRNTKAWACFDLADASSNTYNSSNLGWTAQTTSTANAASKMGPYDGHKQHKHEVTFNMVERRNRIEGLDL